MIVLYLTCHLVVENREINMAKIFILFCIISAASSSGATTSPRACKTITSRACQNFEDVRQNAINNHITKELEASYVYMAMGAYFSRDDPNQKGFAKFFYKASLEEREHAMKLIEYQNERGGRVHLYKIQDPANQTWSSGLEAMEQALALEKKVNDALLTLHESADEDPNMQDFLESNYLNEQVESIRELSGYISQLKRLRVVNPGLGEHVFDEFLLGK